MRSRKKREDRNEQVVRILMMVRELARYGGLTVDELAQLYGKDRRTVYRDLGAIEQAQIPIERERADDGRRVRHRIDLDAARKKLASLLDASHYLALRVAMEGLDAPRGTSTLFARLEDLGQKIEDAIGGAGRQQLEAIERCFHTTEKGTFLGSSGDVFWPLVEAIPNHRLCRVTYRAPRAEPRNKRYEILPLRLFAHHGVVYLMVWVPKHGAYGTLHLQRIRELRVLDRTLAPPADFDPDAQANLAFGVYGGGTAVEHRLRFRADIAPFIRERRWHPTQKAVERAGGELELVFSCRTSPEVTAWVSSWGSGVEVLAPPALRRELAALGTWLSDTYGREPVPKKRPARR